MSHERRAEKSTCAFFEDDHVAQFRFELFLDLERLRINLYPLAIGGIDRVRFRFFASFGGGVENRNLERARQGEKFLGRLDGVVSVNAARTFMCLDQFVRLLWSPLVSEIIEIDCQESWPLPDVSLSMIRGV